MDGIEWFWQATMSHNVIIHFRCEGRMYCLVLKHAVEEIDLSMVEARICKKVGLDECNVKLKLSYIPLLVGSDEKFVICDEEDLCGYLLSLDKNNRRCILLVEVIERLELSEQLSRAGKPSSKRSSKAGKRNSVGMNYEVCHSNDDEIGDKAITRYGGDNQVNKQYE